MLVSLTVGKVDAGVAVLLTQDKRLIEFPSILLPQNISSGSIVDITVSRNLDSEARAQKAFHALQESIYASFGSTSPSPPVLSCRNATQTSVVLEWDPIDAATADVISLALFRNGQKAGNIPKPTITKSTKISGLAVDTEYVFHLVLRTTAGTFSSEKVHVRTHKMTDLSGITITPGIMPAQMRDNLAKTVDRIGAKIADTVRIDTTHFVTTEGRGLQWEKAVDMNVPVVRPEWVEGCERGGRIVGVRQYYLDADPRGRQVPVVPSQPQQPQQPTTPQTPAAKAETPKKSGEAQGANGAEKDEVPPTPPSKEEKAEEAGEDDDEEEDEKTAAPSEQKIRASERASQNLAIRPSAEVPSKGENQKSEGSTDGHSDGGSGAQTPGDTKFENVAL